MKDADGNFTTSFIRRDTPVKDNRLFPKGWTTKGPAPNSFNGDLLRSTFADGEAANDPNHLNGSGTSVVRYEIPLAQLPKGTDPSKLTVTATLYYQSIPALIPDAALRTSIYCPGDSATVLFDSRG